MPKPSIWGGLNTIKNRFGAVLEGLRKGAQKWVCFLAVWCYSGTPKRTPKFDKHQHKTNFERVQEGSEDTGHMQVFLEGVQDRFLVTEAAPGRGEVSKPSFGGCFGNWQWKSR